MGENTIEKRAEQRQRMATHGNRQARREDHGPGRERDGGSGPGDGREAILPAAGGAERRNRK